MAKAGRFAVGQGGRGYECAHGRGGMRFGGCFDWIQERFKSDPGVGVRITSNGRAGRALSAVHWQDARPIRPCRLCGRPGSPRSRCLATAAARNQRAGRRLGDRADLLSVQQYQAALLRPRAEGFPLLFGEIEVVFFTPINSSICTYASADVRRGISERTRRRVLESCSGLMNGRILLPSLNCSNGFLLGWVWGALKLARQVRESPNGLGQAEAVDLW